jgi:S-adenosylmethionine synthetase
MSDPSEPDHQEIQVIMRYQLASESITEGHPDKVCDYVADSILDAYITQDPRARVACEVLCKKDIVVLAGEITSNATVDHEGIVRGAIRDIGYVDAAEPFHAGGVRIYEILTKQASEIAFGVDASTNASGEQGAGDQGIMFGYATAETPELMPLPIVLAHRLARGLAEDRRSGRYAWLRPDGKTQVAVEYDGDEPVRVASVLVSAQHGAEIDQDSIRRYVIDDLSPRALGTWFHPGIAFKVNPAGSYREGGPGVDCGVTGRKIIVDTYGGAAHHGGGAFSGKDPSKVDRSGAYFCRYVARQVVKEGLARRAEIQVSYAIGDPKPFSIKVETYGTGDPVKARDFVMDRFDFRPAEIIRRLDLLRPIYRQTTNYGHLGKPGLPWEA